MIHNSDIIIVTIQHPAFGMRRFYPLDHIKITWKQLAHSSLPILLLFIKFNSFHFF